MTAPADTIEIHIRGLPVPVWARSQEHADELIREFTLIAARPSDDGRHELPQRLSELIERLTGQYAGLTEEQDAELAAAAEAGTPEVNLDFVLPREITAAVVELSDMLDAADDYCRAGQHLLTLATPPEALLFRRWYLGEFLRQAAGRPPMPWSKWTPAEWPVDASVGD